MEENTYKLGAHGTGQGMVATLMQFGNYQIENALLFAMFLRARAHMQELPERVITGPASAGGGSWCGPPLLPIPTHSHSASSPTPQSPCPAAGGAGEPPWAPVL